MGRWLLLATLAAIAGLVGWFAYDMLPDHRVAPGVVLEGRSVGSMPAEEAEQVIADLAAQAHATPVQVTAGDDTIETTAADLGLRVDEAATLEDVLAIGRTSGVSGRLAHWVSTILRSVDVDLVTSFEVEETERHLAEHPLAQANAPRDPVIRESGGVMVVEAGVPQRRLDVADAVDSIVTRFRPGQPLAVEGKVEETPPARADAPAVAFAEKLNQLTAAGATVTLPGSDTVGRVTPEVLRRAITVRSQGLDYGFTFDVEALQSTLAELLGDVRIPGSKPVFEVDDDEPRVAEPGSATLGCCAPEAGDVLAAAVEKGAGGEIELPPTPIGDPQTAAWAAGEGVEEVVGTFTTEHACCQARVENIHRIADLVRGVVLYPGESFSINEFVGERTVEKGFVPAGVIERGRFRDDVGGGISQFATTTFNAAFFAGLDFLAYQSHSIYIDRYPYGREATLSYPVPDLELENTTLHPVLIWTSYTDTSITVTMYSTPHIEVEETGQEEKPFEECTDVETFRRRTYPDGTVVEDSVKARYRPGEGLDCLGNETPTG